jgi:hypothetical protein
MTWLAFPHFYSLLSLSLVSVIVSLSLCNDLCSTLHLSFLSVFTFFLYFVLPVASFFRLVVLPLFVYPLSSLISFL